MDALTTEGLYNYMKARGAQDGEYGDPNTNWFIGAYFKDRILDKLPEDIEEGIAEGWCWKADTLEEVAEMAGLPVENVLATVEKYNGYYYGLCIDSGYIAATEAVAYTQGA